MSTSPAQLASVDGAITPVADALIPITDEGLLRGDGAFEVARLYGGRAFALEDHLSRLEHSCLGLRLPVEIDRVRIEVEALLAAAGAIDALLRIVVTRGGRRIAIIEPLPPRPDSARVVTMTYAPNRILDGLKTLSYAANMLAGRLAKEQGGDEALLVTPHGRVLEGPTWTFFWAHGAELCTPPLSEPILASITRQRLVESLAPREQICTLADLESASEAFIASSVREVLPIASIDGRPLPAVGGPITRAAAAALTEAIERELAAAAS